MNVYAEELPKPGEIGENVEVIEIERNGNQFFGARIFLASADELHHHEGDDDRSAITIWGPPHRVAMILEVLAEKLWGVPNRGIR